MIGALVLRIGYLTFFQLINFDNVVMSLLTLPVFLFVYKSAIRVMESEQFSKTGMTIWATVTKNKIAALFALATAIVTPLGFDIAILNNYQWAIATIVIFFTIYSVLELDTHKQWYVLLALPVLAAFIHFTALILIPIFLLYLIFIALEHETVSRNEVMFISLASVLVLLIVLVVVGLPSRAEVISKIAQSLVLQQNPRAIAFSKEASFDTIATVIGLHPILIGLIGAYLAILAKNKSALIYLSTIIVSFGLVSFKVIPIIFGIPYFFLGLAVLASYFMIYIIDQINISRFRKATKFFILFFFITVMLSGIVQWVFKGVMF